MTIYVMTKRLWSREYARRNLRCIATAPFTGLSKELQCARTLSRTGKGVMNSPSAMRRRQRRLFAWMFLLATTSLSSLVGVEILFPPSVLSPPLERSVLDLLEFDLPEPQLLAVVVALVVGVASMAGLALIGFRDLLKAAGRALSGRRRCSGGPPVRFWFRQATLETRLSRPRKT